MHGAKNMKESGFVKELVWLSCKREEYLESCQESKHKSEVIQPIM
jgi:hypothetical protein